MVSQGLLLSLPSRPCIPYAFILGGDAHLHTVV